MLRNNILRLSDILGVLQSHQKGLVSGAEAVREIKSIATEIELESEAVEIIDIDQEELKQG